MFSSVVYLRTLYNALVYPILEYGLIVFAKYLLRFDRMQNTFLPRVVPLFLSFESTVCDTTVSNPSNIPKHFPIFTVTSEAEFNFTSSPNGSQGRPCFLFVVFSRVPSYFPRNLTRFYFPPIHSNSYGLSST